MNWSKDLKTKIELPNDVNSIINILEENGHEAYVVGGCVRDALLNKKPNDWDITTSALPEQVKELFSKSFDTGLKHGTITVVLKRVNYEVTTFRVEGKYTDGRRPDNVFFSKSIEADLSRRDFTINAMAYNSSKGIIDPFGGYKDLENGKIKAVGIPEDRFSEDALRMLRAVRFSAQLGFEIVEETCHGINANASKIKMISGERIRVELEKTLTSLNPDKIRLLLNLGLMQYILPEFTKCFQTPQNHPYHIYNVGEHIIKTLQNIDPVPVLRWTMLFHDIGKAYCRTTDEKGIDHFYKHGEKSVEIARGIMNRLKFDNKTKDRVCMLVKNHDRLIHPTGKSIRRAAVDLGEEGMRDLFKVMKADKSAQNPAYFKKSLKELELVIKEFENSMEKKHCMSNKELKINGHDLIKLGITDGIEIGNTLKELLELVIEFPELNEKEKLIDMAKSSYEFRS